MTDRNPEPATDDTSNAGPRIQPPPSGSNRGRNLTTLLLIVGVVVFAGLALEANWTEVRGSLDELSFGDLAASTVAAVLSLTCSWLVWRRVLAALGGSLEMRPSATIYFTGQIGKYVPGSIWPVVIQSQLGVANGVSRSVMVASYGVTLVLTIAAAGIVGPLLLVGGADPIRLLIVAGGLALAVVAVTAIVHPRGVRRLTAWVARRTGRTLPDVHLDRRAVLPPLGGALLSWGLFGLHTWTLARPLGASAADLAPVAAAFAVAFVAGLLVIPLPAGAGVRDAVLVLAMSPIVSRPGALVVALVSRFIILVSEVGLAGAAGVPSAVRSVGAARRRRSTGGDDLSR